jgi:hypothetical protein
MRPESDPTKLVDDWPLPNLSAIHRKRIKAVLLTAHAAFHRSDFQDPHKFIAPMEQAFDGIARVLFEANLLTVAFMENELREFVIDSAASGRWLNRDYHERVAQTLFTAEIAEWGGKLLEREAQLPTSKKTPATKPVPAEIERRKNLLEEYKRDTGVASNRKIYTAENCPIHKAEFHEWLKGELAKQSKTTSRFEEFLRNKRRPQSKS